MNSESLRQAKRSEFYINYNTKNVLNGWEKMFVKLKRCPKVPVEYLAKLLKRGNII